MNVGKFERCPLCKEFGWLGGDRMNHVCAPEWECRLETEDDRDWHTIHAHDSETAAEKYAEYYDCEGGEYAIVSGGYRNGCFVLVRKLGGETERWAIEGETAPQYRAYKAEPSPTPRQPERE